MGLDLFLNALPAACGLLDAMQSGETDPQNLCFVNCYFRHRDTVYFTPSDVKALEAIVASHPGIEHRRCDLDDYQVSSLTWLLVQCAKGDEEKRIARASIYGEVSLFQLNQFGWNSLDMVGLIHIWIRTLKWRDLRRHFDANKWNKDENRSRAFNCLGDSFARLQRFYDMVYARREAVLSVRN
jgi:hypothetical protein